MNRFSVGLGLALSIVGAMTAALAGQEGRAKAVARSAPFDPVAAIVMTPHGPGYAYNRYSGQVYHSCVIDLGYGRTRPCDGGNR